MMTLRVLKNSLPIDSEESRSSFGSLSLSSSNRVFMACPFGICWQTNPVQCQIEGPPENRPSFGGGSKERAALRLQSVWQVYAKRMAGPFGQPPHPRSTSGTKNAIAGKANGRFLGS